MHPVFSNRPCLDSRFHLEGLLIYSLDKTVTFDPFDLTIDSTPQSILEALDSHKYLKALVIGFRLNKKPLIQRVYEKIPREDICLITQQLPVIYIPLLLRFVADAPISSVAFAKQGSVLFSASLDGTARA